MPGSLAAGYAYRSEIGGGRRRLAALLAPSLLGGAAGAALVVGLGNARFAALAPWLVLAATGLFLAGGLRQRLAPASTSGLPGSGPLALLALGQLAIAVYGGFFGAGMGVLMLALYGFWGLANLHEMNGLKSLAAAAINAAAAAYFALSGEVDWPLVALMATGAIAGGYAGALLARRVGQRWVRLAVGAIGLGFSAYLLARRL